MTGSLQLHKDVKFARSCTIENELVTIAFAMSDRLAREIKMDKNLDQTLSLLFRDILQIAKDASKNNLGPLEKGCIRCEN